MLALRVRPSWIALAWAFAIGNAWASLVDAWGLVTPTALGYLALVAASMMRRRTRSR